MSEKEGEIEIDLSNLFEIAGGDNMFVAALLGKMVKQLPESFDRMEKACEVSDWQELKSAAHKAKGTFAYLAMEDMRGKLRDIENDAYEEVNVESLPKRVEEALELGNAILGQLKLELTKLM